MQITIPFSIKKIKGRLIDLTPLLVILIAFSMVFWRAANLSIAHDEALTVNTFASETYTDILGITGSVGGYYANNHPLNSALIKFFISFLGVNEISARLPALLGQLMYLIAGYSLVTFLFNQWWKRTIALSFLAFHPFLIDLFSAARGYGLSLGLLTTGIALMAYCVKTSVDKNYKWSEMGLFLSALATTSNLNFVHPFLALLVCHYFITLKSSRHYKFPTFLRGLIIAAVPIFLVYFRNSFEAYRQGLFDVGGKGGFWRDTLPSLIGITIYRFDFSVAYQKLRVIFLIIAGVGSWFVLKAHKPVTYFLTAICFLPVLTVYLATKFAGVDSVAGRYAVYFIPLFSLFLLSIWSSLDTKFNKIGSLVALCVILFLTGYYLTSIQFSYYSVWPYDQHTKEVFSTILEDYKTSGKTGPITIGASWLFEPSLNFYRAKYSTVFVQPVSRATTNKPYTYYYIFDNFGNPFDSIDKVAQVENMQDIKTKYNLKILKYFEDTKSTLLVSQE